MTATNTSASASPADQPRRARILVADDSSEMRALLDELLSDEGYDVTVAASGARALSIMNDDPPDLLITDLLMPGMSGFALRTLMLRRPDLAAVRVVVLSAYWHRPSETLDVAAVLEKPLNIDRLLETVRRLTDGTGTVDERADGPDPS
jgi:CheY-like chemotaxis protein